MSTRVQLVPSISRSFPTQPERDVARDNILLVLETMLAGSTQVVVVEGEDGIGRTTLLAQFALRHPQTTMSLFLQPLKLSYDPEIVRADLATQAFWTLKQEEIPIGAELDDSFYRKVLFKLHGLARAKRHCYNFVIDGLEDVRRRDPAAISHILDLLPIAYSSFRFIIADDFSQLAPNLSSVTCKPYQLAGFSLDETGKYFEDLSLSKETVERIHHTSRGVPGNLASVRRIIANDPARDLETLPAGQADLFRVEWSRVNDKDRTQLDILALVAHSRSQHNANEIARLLSLSTPEAVLDAIKTLPFIVRSHDTSPLIYVSDAFRRFASVQLKSLQTKITELLITDLASSPRSDAALTYLADYLQEAGKYDQLLDYLQPDVFSLLLERNVSVTSVLQKADLGIATARKLSRESDLVRLTVQRCAIANMGRPEVWRSEVDALLSLEDYAAALNLAHSTVLNESRLHLLVLIAKKKRQRGLTAEPELMDEITQLYQALDHESLGERAVEIASDMIYSRPDLAIELLERATRTPSTEHSIDLTLAKLSLDAQIGNERISNNPEDIGEELRARIKNPRLRGFAAASAALVREYSVSQALAEARKLESAADQLFLLTSWARVHVGKENPTELIKYAISLAIRSSSYTPNATVLNDLAALVQHVPDLATGRELIGALDGQRAVVERLGPTPDYVRLQLNLARAEKAITSISSTSRVIDVYLYISAISDTAVKAECLAWLYSFLVETDPHKDFNKTEGLHDLARQDLYSAEAELLRTTASHHKVTKGIIRALATSLPMHALDLAKRLNTERRRNEALLTFIQNSVSNSAVVNADAINIAIQEITDDSYRDAAITTLIEETCNSTAPPMTDVVRVSEYVFTIRDAVERCRAGSLMYAAIDDNELRQHLLDEIMKSWTCIDIGWERVDAGFRIASCLATKSQLTAQEHLKNVETVRNDVGLDSPATARPFLMCIRLVIRAYRGLLLTHSEKVIDNERLRILINRVPSRGARAHLWSEFAEVLVISGRVEESRRVVSEFVRPLISDIPPGDDAYHDRILVCAAPALFSAHPQLALETINQMSGNCKHFALAGVVNFIFTKCPTHDPYDFSKRKGFDVTYEELVTICGLAELVMEDGLVYSIVARVADSISGGPKANKYTENQRADLINRLSNLADAKFPDPKNIQHEGYTIVTNAQILRLQRKARSSDWATVVDKARNIPNLADSAFVLILIAELLPTREADLRKEILKEAKGLIDKMPTLLDRVHRLQEMADHTRSLDSKFAGEILEEAMRVSLRGSDEDIHTVQRQIIDTAYRLDPTLASSLTSLIDSDPARKQMRTNAKKQLRMLELKHKIANERGEKESLESTNAQHCAEAASALLGSLNAGTSQPIRITSAFEYIRLADSFSGGYSYEIVRWFVENTVCKLGGTEAAKTAQRALFENLAAAAELAGVAAVKSSARLRRANLINVSSKETSAMIRPGNREEAMSFLRAWLSENLRDFVKLVDPYFEPQQIDFIVLIRSINPNCRVAVLTSRSHAKKWNVPWEHAFKVAWNSRVSDQLPPPTDIVVVGTESRGELPIHDRWLITSGAGLRLGTSLNGLGVSKGSEISILTGEEALLRESEIDRYAYRLERDHDGDRLVYTVFTL